MSNRNAMSEDERRALENLSIVLRKFIESRPNMPMHQAIVMLAVALDEGHSLKHYAEQTGFPTASVSRAFLDCGPKLRSGAEGLGLLDADRSHQNMREYSTYLTAKGHVFFQSLAKRLAKR